MESARSDSTGSSPLGVISRFVSIGTVIVLAGTIPRNIFFALNLRYFANVPWSVPVTGIYLYFFLETFERRRRPSTVSSRQPSSFSCLAVGSHRWFARYRCSCSSAEYSEPFRCVPEQSLPDLSEVPRFTVLSLFLAAAPIAALSKSPLSADTCKDLSSVVAGCLSLF